ncbi:hypothetical protein PR003_g28122 [Phytophthora rubi]|uniref:Uncharacterized protein n=1 Tax=Phytophthora rubi TaxID=129364 RepID=A0A6A3HSD3_9STRA|nr:hypothetical protein PR002_g27063 [Phytophthora rubi]KAE8971269.1 hypothetical protein PR001_g26942 [Phytophthora rubi]KAE9279834.1 hypothetical protein PR003_g28122 [Phytophthora rubi]
MWSSTPSDDADQLFPRRPRRVPSGAAPSSSRRSSATSRLEQRRRDLPPHSVATGGLWAFDGSTAGSSAFSPSSASPTAFNAGSESSQVQDKSNAGPPGLQSGVRPKNHGVIGSYSSGEATARMLWNRPEREEEEREEEALPSYLSYLQAPSITGDATAAAMPVPSAFGAVSLRPAEDEMETKSKELARALQDFILVQVQGQTGVTTSTSSSSSPSKQGGCGCERRVAELEKQVQSLLAGQKDGGSTTTIEETGSALGDRVSTLEGRQSAFQSQLAQISKVLGVPVGKHGKSSQLKTLVQTLHEEIDSKFQTAVAEVEASCVASATKHAEELIAEAAATASSSSPAGESSTPSDPNDEKKKQASSDYDTTSTSGLPFSTVLNALAEEHEASLTRLSTHFDERLRLEGSQRIALEGRLRARMGELEEWLQQVEGELGGSHFEPTASSTSASIAAMTDQLRKLQTHMSELELSWKQQREEAKQLSAKLEELPAFKAVQTQLDRTNKDVNALRESVASMETITTSTREETRTVARTSQGLKLIVEKLVRDTGSAEELLQQYVSTITHQVASVTRQYVSVRIRDNNRLLDATLRARVPDYVTNESESFLLVRPEAKKEGEERHSLGTEVIHEASGPETNGNFSFVLREDDEDGIRRLLATQRGPQPSTVGTTISSDASAVAAAAGATVSS